MRLSFTSGLLVVGGVSALTVPLPSAPALPLASFPPNPFVKPLSLDEARNAQLTNNTAPTETATPKVNTFAVKAAATCTNPRIRWEWDQASTDTRRAYTSAIKCLMNKPSAGGFGASKSRYEDIVSVHQQYTPNVHGNSKFLIWHRYYVWAFEQILRNECGFNNDMPWFDETKYAGRYSQSSIFSNDWYGAIAIGGQCVTNGLFAGLTLNIGPGSGNTPHCLSRNGDASKTANTNSDMVNACNARTDYKDMASCAEGGAHAWGHNGIGAVMADVYASPGDPVFFLHHAFIDRNFRIWQNADSARVTYIDGTDVNGNALTLDTTMNVKGLVPDVTVRDFINTLDGKACYRYNY